MTDNSGPGSSATGGAGLASASTESDSTTGIDEATAERPRWTCANTARTILAAVLVAGMLAAAAVLHGSHAHGVDAAFSLLIGVTLGIICERGRFCFFCIFRDMFEEKNS